MINPATAEAPAGAAPADTPESYNGGAPRGHLASKFTIPGNVIAKATADLPQREKNAILWIADFCRSRNLSHGEVAPRLKQPGGDGYSPSSLWHALTGGRSAEQLENIVRAIERYRESVEAGQVPASVDDEFFPTITSKKIDLVCRRAMARRRPAFVFGETQIGKTTGFEEVQRRENKKAFGRVKIFRMPTGGIPSHLKAEMAQVLDVSTALRGNQLRDALFTCIDPADLLIFDDCQECFDGEAKRAGRSIHTLNFIKEIWDRRKCAIILSGTPLFKRGILYSKEAESLKQLWRRSICPLELPSTPTPGELAVFAQGYGLDSAPDHTIEVNVTRFDEDTRREIKEKLTCNPLQLQTEVLKKDGLGRWKIILRDAADLAREKRRPNSWGLVLHAWHTFSQFETGKERAS